MPDKHLCGNYRKGLNMSKQCWVRVFLQPYPVLLAHVHGHLFLEGCCSSLFISLQITERIFDHYRLVQTATKCSGSHPFWLEKCLCEGASVTLRIQSTRALILTHHLLVSASVSSLYKRGRLNLFFFSRELEGIIGSISFKHAACKHFSSVKLFKTQLRWFSQNFIQSVTHSLPWGPTAEPTSPNTS